MTIEERIALFKEDIVREDLSVESIFQKHIVDSHNYFFEKVLTNRELEYNVREIVAKYFNVHLNEVTVVGSSKLGFSLAPKKLFYPFDHAYDGSKKRSDRSDLDISIVSPELFESLGRRVYDHTNSFKRSWGANEYYGTDKTSVFPVPINYMFFQYLSRGWFRMDFKPSGFEVCQDGSYEEMKRDILLLTKRKVAIGIYKNWQYYKDYHLDTLNKLRLKIRNEII